MHYSETCFNGMQHDRIRSIFLHEKNITHSTLKILHSTITSFLPFFKKKKINSLLKTFIKKVKTLKRFSRVKKKIERAQSCYTRVNERFKLCCIKLTDLNNPDAIFVTWTIPFLISLVNLHVHSSFSRPLFFFLFCTMTP